LPKTVEIRFVIVKNSSSGQLNSSKIIFQLKIAKDRKKGEKIVTDSQEKAYWRVYRPPPGYTTVVESSPVPTREQRSKARSRTREHLTDEVINGARGARGQVVNTERQHN
jgi:hypothetical protein